MCECVKCSAHILNDRKKKKQNAVCMCAHSTTKPVCVNWSTGFFSIFRVCITINIGCVSVLQVQLVQSYMFCLEFILYRRMCSVWFGSTCVCVNDDWVCWPGMLISQYSSIWNSFRIIIIFEWMMWVCVFLFMRWRHCNIFSEDRTVKSCACGWDSSWN